MLHSQMATQREATPIISTFDTAAASSKPRTHKSRRPAVLTNFASLAPSIYCLPRNQSLPKLCTLRPTYPHRDHVVQPNRQPYFRRPKLAWQKILPTKTALAADL